MNKFIDLTHTFTNKMPVYPGDPCPKLYQIADIENDGFNDFKIETGMHVGTHMDAPLHMLHDGKYISEIPVSKFCGRGHLIDARDLSVIDQTLLINRDIKLGDIVLVMTGFYKKFYEESYYETFPELTEDFAKMLVELGVNIVGMDTPSPDRAPYLVHKILLSSEVLIIENLNNLESLLNLNSFFVHAYPAKFHSEAAPVRVVAELV